MVVKNTYYQIDRDHFLLLDTDFYVAFNEYAVRFREYYACVSNTGMEINNAHFI